MPDINSFAIFNRRTKKVETNSASLLAPHNKKTFFITGGGTGGHIYPAIAIAKALLAEGNEVFFVGNNKNLEYKICIENGLNFLSVSVGYMPRKIDLKFIFWGIKTFFASLVAGTYILKHKPDAVFATGGYVSAPTLIASTILKTPFMTHDCDAYPGIVSRVFSKYARATSLAFEDAKKYLKTKNIYFYGNPIRECFFEKKARESSTPTLLIMGGSQGAKTLNEAGMEVIKHFAKRKDIKIILQTGAKNYDETLNAIGVVPENATVAPYFSDMSIPLSQSDLVVSRAGSLSISEICAVGLPSILVPYPYSAADHQRLNARIMEQLGASIFLDDAHCSGSALIKLVNDLFFDKEKLESLANAAKAQSKPDATRNIIEKLKEISK